jgi:hypothetical protein
MFDEIYTYDLKRLYEDYATGNREAGMKINGILTFKADYGDFVSAEDLFKAHEMLRKCENALELAIMRPSFRELCKDSIKKAYARIEALWRDYAYYGRV